MAARNSLRGRSSLNGRMVSDQSSVGGTRAQRRVSALLRTHVRLTPGGRLTKLRQRIGLDRVFLLPGVPDSAISYSSRNLTEAPMNTPTNGSSAIDDTIGQLRACNALQTEMIQKMEEYGCAVSGAGVADQDSGRRNSYTSEIAYLRRWYAALEALINTLERYAEAAGASARPVSSWYSGS